MKILICIVLTVLTAVYILIRVVDCFYDWGGLEEWLRRIDRNIRKK